MLDFKFWILLLTALVLPYISAIHYYHKTKTFYFWFGMIEGRSEVSNGWMLFGLSINDYAGVRQVYTKFILTLFNHNINFGRAKELRSI